jgi:hypothetical protein
VAENIFHRGTLIMSAPLTLSPVQRAALLSANGPARFKHFVGQAADSERLWGLRDSSGWVALADDSGAEGFAVWPHPDYAAECAKGVWANCFPAEIDVHAFADSWLPDMAERGVSVAVFPTLTMQAVWISPDELRRHLAEELARYE